MERACLGTVLATLLRCFTPVAGESFIYPFATPGKTTATVVVTSTDPKPFNAKLMGVNTNGQGINMQDPRMTSLFSAVHLPQVRFPGGTVGNFYDWETDRFYPDSPVGEANRTFSFNAYAKLMRKTGASSVLTFNVLTDGIEKSVARLKNRTAAGLILDFVEMGNENYAVKQGGGRLNGSSPNAYVDFTRKLSAALKSHVPGLRTAVVMTPFEGFREGGWNAVLAAKDYYDAVVMHPYVLGQGVSDVKSARQALEASLKVQQHVDDYRKHFGTRPLLFSEWGVGVAQTTGQWICTLSEADVFVSKILPLGRQGILHQASKHVLVAGRVTNPGALFAPDASGKVLSTPSGVWYRKFEKELQGASTLETRVADAALLAPDLPTISAFAIHKGDGHVRVLAINRMNVTAHVHVIIDGHSSGLTVSTFSLADPLGWKGFTLDADPWTTVSASDGVAKLPPLSVAVAYAWRELPSLDGVSAVYV